MVCFPFVFVFRAFGVGTGATATTTAAVATHVAGVSEKNNNVEAYVKQNDVQTAPNQAIESDVS